MREDRTGRYTHRMGNIEEIHYLRSRNCVSEESNYWVVHYNKTNAGTVSFTIVFSIVGVHIDSYNVFCNLHNANQR